MDFNIERGLPFFVMEYATQGSLRKLHPKGSQLSLKTVVGYVRQVSAALHYAHEHRQIHRDVKPENILVRDDGSLMLSDFGIATLAHSSVSQSSENMIGTVTYIAPEQTPGHSHFASDQYALATTAYEWLAGKSPFQGTAVEIAIQHATAIPPSLTAQLASLPPMVESTIFKALAKEPKARFPDVQLFALALVQAERGIYDPSTFPEPLAQPATNPQNSPSLSTNVNLGAAAKKPEPAPPQPARQQSPIAQQRTRARESLEGLDQLWYTWSQHGLGVGTGYRVRAASGELRNTQSMRYRLLDRFLRYELPQGININEFDARNAPISYAFISNGPERLLIRKVFKGRDPAGRNPVFYNPPPADARDLQRYRVYVRGALDYLILVNSGEAFLDFLKNMEARQCQSTEQLLEEFTLAFAQGQLLTFKQVETIITHPGKYGEKLRDPLFQQQSAALLVENSDYWRAQGQQTFQQVSAQLAAADQSEPTYQALASYVQGLTTSLLDILREGLQQFKAREAQRQNPWQSLRLAGDLLVTLVPPASQKTFGAPCKQRSSLLPANRPLYNYYESALCRDGHTFWPVLAAKDI